MAMARYEVVVTHMCLCRSCNEFHGRWLTNMGRPVIEMGVRMWDDWQDSVKLWSGGVACHKWAARTPHEDSPIGNHLMWSYGSNNLIKHNHNHDYMGDLKPAFSPQTTQKYLVKTVAGNEFQSTLPDHLLYYTHIEPLIMILSHIHGVKDGLPHASFFTTQKSVCDCEESYRQSVPIYSLPHHLLY